MAVFLSSDCLKRCWLWLQQKLFHPDRHRASLWVACLWNWYLSGASCWGWTRHSYGLLTSAMPRARRNWSSSMMADSALMTTFWVYWLFASWHSRCTLRKALDHPLLWCSNELCCRHQNYDHVCLFWVQPLTPTLSSRILSGRWDADERTWRFSAHFYACSLQDCWLAEARLGSEPAVPESMVSSLLTITSGATHLATEWSSCDCHGRLWTTTDPLLAQSRLRFSDWGWTRRGRPTSFESYSYS